ncbi:MAG: hypothetical protein JSR65_00020 [Proteobacteria bacterium]|nr:hypothetical protein [Pseudomonadota bacterium]
MFYWRWFNRPRHPLARVLIGALGVVLLVGVLALGFLALVAFAVIGAIVALARAFLHTQTARPVPPQQPNVIEGEFVVLPNRTATVKH